jgi:hypothetical protein
MKLLLDSQKVVMPVGYTDYIITENGTQCKDGECCKNF